MAFPGFGSVPCAGHGTTFGKIPQNAHPPVSGGSGDLSLGKDIPKQDRVYSGLSALTAVHFGTSGMFKISSWLLYNF